MTSTSSVLPRFFVEPISFFEVGIGTEKLVVKPDWQTAMPTPSDRAEQRKAA